MDSDILPGVLLIAVGTGVTGPFQPLVYTTLNTGRVDMETFFIIYYDLLPVTKEVATLEAGDPVVAGVAPVLETWDIKHFYIQN